MPVDDRRPSWDVRVGLALGSPEYALLAEWLHGHDAGPWWEALGDLLGGRTGWHCDLAQEGLTWSFGALGASMFNITWSGSDDGPPNGYELFDYELDGTLRFIGINELRFWLEENERRHKDHARRLSDLVSADSWSLLKSFPWNAHLTHEGRSWVGSIDKLPGEATFADDLSTLIVQLKQLIASCFGAPVEVAPDIGISLQLDQSATRVMLR